MRFVLRRIMVGDEGIVWDFVVCQQTFSVERNARRDYADHTPAASYLSKRFSNRGEHYRLAYSRHALTPSTRCSHRCYARGIDKRPIEIKQNSADHLNNRRWPCVP